MKPEEVAGFYAIAIGYDSRLKPLSIENTKIWADHLKTIPFIDSHEILAHIYSTPVLVTLQPGHVTEAWEEIKAARARIVNRIRSIDRYLAATNEDDPDVLAEKLEARARYVNQLPQHVIHYANVAERQLNPPPKYPRQEQPTQIIDFTKALKQPT